MCIRHTTMRTLNEYYIEGHIAQKINRKSLKLCTALCNNHVGV